MARAATASSALRRLRREARDRHVHVDVIGPGAVGRTRPEQQIRGDGEDDDDARTPRIAPKPVPPSRTTTVTRCSVMTARTSECCDLPPASRHPAGGRCSHVRSRLCSEVTGGIRHRSRSDICPEATARCHEPVTPRSHSCEAGAPGAALRCDQRRHGRPGAPAHPREAQEESPWTVRRRPWPSASGRPPTPP